jgi:hypothetical protein
VTPPTAPPGFLVAPTRFLFFTGKGGVGKTSLSTATAITLADSGRRVLLVSTDDTAPTGHTLRLLSLPKAWSGFLAGNDRGASCLGPHSGLKMQEARFNAALAALADPALTTVVLVTRPDPSPIQEAARTSGELRALGCRRCVPCSRTGPRSPPRSTRARLAPLYPPSRWTGWPTSSPRWATGSSWSWGRAGWERRRSPRRSRLASSSAATACT